MMMRSFILPGLLVMVAWCWLGSALAGAQGKATVIEGPAGEIEVAALFDNDWAWFIQEGDAREALTEGDPTARDPFVDGTEFRRGRIGFSGPLAPHFEFNLEYDFIDGDARPADVYLEANKLPLVGVVRIGHQYEPLNRLTGSSKHLLFLEKPLPNALSTGRNTGLRTLTSAFHKRATLSTGIFRDAGETGASATNESWNLAARVTAVPFYQDAGRTMAHLGAFYGHRKIGAGGEVRFRQRPESHLAPYLVDTGALDASGVNLFGFESAAILGPASLQAEYMGADLEDEGAGKVRFWGAYVTAAWLLTGEHRPYSLASAAFVRLEPRKPFDPAAGGWGAWMLMARYSHLDLEDGAVEGGKLSDLSFGLNWYATGRIRFMANYIFADAEELGKLQIAQMRMQAEL
ncbi:MAG: hypothetical protein KBD56_08965 [Candidatus Eisenbacteria bacterium]|nr:hypothetical protein [Candidatus Eisenbacteria bacterium]